MERADQLRAGSEAAAERLLVQLIERTADQCGAHGAWRTDFCGKMKSYCTRLLASHLTPTASTEFQVIENMKRDLTKAGRAEEAIRVSELTGQIASGGHVRNLWSALYVFHALARPGGESFAYPSSQYRSRAPLPLREPRPAPALSHADQASEAIASVSVLEQAAVSSSATKQRHALYKRFKELKVDSMDVSEAVLVRDVLYAMQGIDGRYIHFEDASDTYVLDATIFVPAPMRGLVQRLCEPGWLFRRIRAHLRKPEEGVIAQSLKGAIQDEMAEYFRLLAVLEGQIVLPETDSVRLAEDGLTLRRLAVWSEEPLQRLRTIALILDGSDGCKGGMLASRVFEYSQHGDPAVALLVERILRQVSAPFFEMIRKWVFEGELEDAYGEFFVKAKDVETDEELWSQKYFVDNAMVPSFIDPVMTSKVFNTGKSINFLRYCCADMAYVRDSSARGLEAANDLAYGNSETMRAAIDGAAALTNAHLLSTMRTKFKLLEHCDAIRRYLLLGQGDFIEVLMDMLGEELGKPAERVRKHNLTGVVEAALRASNAQYDDPEVLERLDVRMLQASAGDTGWEVFALDYRVDSPISTVFDPASMAKYYKIFVFLWKLKRIEHSLTSAWSQHMQIHSELQALGAPRDTLDHLRVFHGLRNEMVHFLSNLQHYVMFDVLEASWDALEKDLPDASDLDELISAHKAYVESIEQRALLSRDSRHAHAALCKVIDCIAQFTSIQSRLHVELTEAAAKLHAAAETRGRDAGWGTDDRTEEEIAAALAVPVKLRESAQSTLEEYRKAVWALLRHMEDTDRLPFTSPLRFKLDFNEFYEAAHGDELRGAPPGHAPEPSPSPPH